MADEDLRHITGMPDIPRVEINPDAIRAFTTNSDFMWLAVELLKEVAAYTCNAAGLTDETGTWSRDEAVVGGNMIRLYKLMHAILDQTTQKRGEIAFTLFRLAFETIVNVRYLIKHHAPDLVTSYVSLALQSAARRHAVQVAVDVELQQRRRMIGRPAGRGWRHRKAQASQIELVHEDVDHPHRVVLRHVVIKAAGKQRRLPAVFTFDEAGHLITPNLATSRVYGASRFYTASVVSLRWLGARKQTFG